MNALTKQPAPTTAMLAPALMPANMRKPSCSAIMASAKLVHVGLQKSVPDYLMVVHKPCAGI